MVLVVWLPRLWTHIAKGFTTSACHKVATHRSFNSLLAPRADLCILRYPFCVSLLFQHIFHPLSLLLTLCWIMIIAETFETKYFAASACYCFKWRIDFNAFIAVGSCAKLIVLISCNKHFADLLLIFSAPVFSLLTVKLEHTEDCLHEHWTLAITIHAIWETCAYNTCLQMSHPTLQTIMMTAYVIVYWHFFRTANLACTYFVPIKLLWVL